MSPALPPWGRFAVALALVMLINPAGGRAEPEEPPAPVVAKLLPHERERMRERDRDLAEARRLHRFQKLPEASVAAQKVLAAEHAVYGAFHADVARTLRLLVTLYEERDDFARARVA